MPFLLSWVPESALKRFDLVSLDPRGTGGSAPINCPAVPDDPDTATPNVLTEGGFAQAAAVERQQTRACIRALASHAPHFTTQTAARDVDRLRAAVGDEALTFLGGSYGAKLGAEYAHQFPNSVRAAVLDGPSEPSATVFDSIVRQTKGFEQTFGIYAQGCATTRPACQLGDPHAFLARLVARADAAPIPSRRAGEDRRADGTYVLDAVRAALTAEERWPDLDEILSETAFGNSAGIFAMVDNVSGPPIPDSAPADPADANYVINCNDSDLGPTDEQIHIRARAMARDYPLFGAHSAFNLFACKTWQRQRTVLEPPVAATRNRLLVVGTVHDAATPYAGAVALTKPRQCHPADLGRQQPHRHGLLDLRRRHRRPLPHRPHTPARRNTLSALAAVSDHRQRGRWVIIGLRHSDLQTQCRWTGKPAPSAFVVGVTGFEPATSSSPRERKLARDMEIGPKVVHMCSRLSPDFATRGYQLVTYARLAGLPLVAYSIVGAREERQRPKRLPWCSLFHTPARGPVRLHVQRSRSLCPCLFQKFHRQRHRHRHKRARRAPRRSAAALSPRTTMGSTDWATGGAWVSIADGVPGGLRLPEGRCTRTGRRDVSCFRWSPTI